MSVRLPCICNQNPCACENKKRPLDPGFRYVRGKTETEIELPSGERVERMPGKDDKPAFHPEEIEYTTVAGKRAYRFPPGFERVKEKKEHGASKAFASLVDIRSKVVALADLYSAGWKPADGGPPVPFDWKEHNARIRRAEERAKRLETTPRYGIFYADYDEHREPCFYYDPPLLTSDLVDDDGSPIISSGWSTRRPIVVNGARVPTPIVRGHPTVHYAEMRGRGKKRVVVEEYDFPIFEYRGESSLPKEEVEAAGIRIKKSKSKSTIILDLLGQGLIEVPENGEWRLTTKGRKCLKPDKLWVTHPCVVRKTNFHVRTSKMGCASWNLPAGPPKVGDQEFHGSCLAATPLDIHERLALKIEAGETSSDDEIEDEDEDEDGEDTVRAPTLVTLKSAKEYTEIREKAGHRIVELARKVDAEGGQSNTTEYSNDELICAKCYSLKANYAYANGQFWQTIRFRWAKAAVAAGYFADFMVAAIRAYYAPEHEAERLAYAEDTRFYRVHDSGDFFSVPYINAWIDVARRMPEVRFWAPTRMWINGPSRAAFASAPENFAIRPSAIHFRDAAPEVNDMAGGSTGSPKPLVRHWNCPATTHDRSACIGAMTHSDKYNDLGAFKFISGMQPGETACRVCWGGFDYMTPEQRADIARLPVSYKEH